MSQYLGEYSISERLFDFNSLKDFGVYPMRGGVQNATYFEHCIPLAILKMALFGEYSIWKDIGILDAISNCMFWINLVIVLTSLASMVYCAFLALKKQPRAAFYKRFGFGKAVLLFFIIYWNLLEFVLYF